MFGWSARRLVISTFLSFLVWPLIPTHCWCRGLLLHPITVGDTHTSTHTNTHIHFLSLCVCRTPLDEVPARRRDLYLTTYNIHNRQTSMPPGGIRTSNPSKRVAADTGLRPRSHRDRPFTYKLLQLAGYLVVQSIGALVS
jgi:hypothetical protein